MKTLHRVNEEFFTLGSVDWNPIATLTQKVAMGSITVHLTVQSSIRNLSMPF